MLRAAMLCALITGCVSETPTGIDTATLSCPPDSTLTYESFGQALIADHCQSCHASQESPRLGTVEQVRAAKGLILHEAVETTNMPANSDMLLEDRQALGEWLACGAP